jgi:uncharacterized protein YkwD
MGRLIGAVALLSMPVAPGCAGQPARRAPVAAPAGAPDLYASERLPRPPRRPGTVFSPAGQSSPIYLSPPLRPDTVGSGRGTLSRFELILVELVTEAARTASASGSVPIPIPDERMHSLARDAARLARRGRPPPSETVRFLGNHYGIIEPDPILYTLHGPADEETVRQRFRLEVPAMFRGSSWNRLGLGTFRQGPEMVTVVAMWEQLLELRPIPREVPSGGKLLLRGRFLRPFHDPQVVITLPSGDVRRLPLLLRSLDFEADLRCAFGDGRYQTEMLASNTTGPLVLANFPVFCGVSAPRDVLVQEEDESEEEVDPADGEQELFALINRDRRTAGLPPLTWDNRLAAIARSHSREMAARRFVAHVSPTTGDAEARVRAAGLGFTLVTENVGQEGGIKPAHEGFMGSPGHRANVLNPKITHVGIGVMAGGARRGPSPLYITELFGGER